MTFNDIFKEILTFYDIACILLLITNKIAGDKMSNNNKSKFDKFIKHIDENNLSDESILHDIKNHSHQLLNRGIQIKLLADDFMKTYSNVISCCPISNGYISPAHNHNFYEINYVVKGKCLQFINGDSIIMNEGDFLFMSPDIFHSSYPTGSSNCVNILIDAIWLEKIGLRITECDSKNYLATLLKGNAYILFRNISEKASGKTTDAIIEIFLKSQNESLLKDLYAESLGVKLLVELADCDHIKTLSSRKNHSVGIKSPDVILQYIRDNISNVTLESAGKYFGYTGTHISRIIKKHTGFSFAVFINTQKMLVAQKLLADTNIPIGNIPQLIGLDSKEYFCRMFKKNLGITPSDYRKTIKNK